MIAIITARGGSKRIPKKNIKDFLGKPIISYSINAAKESGLFDKVMVSTDSEEIKDVALKYGVEVPFMRSEKTSNDFATTRAVLLEVISEYKNIGIEFKEFACIYPTAPFLSGKLLIDAYNRFKNEDASELIPIVKFSFPPQRAFVVKDKYLDLFDKNSFVKRSQDLEPLYHDCGQFYFYKTKDFLDSTELILNNTVGFEMNELYVQDIDTLEDWHIAEMKYEIINSR